MLADPKFGLVVERGRMLWAMNHGVFVQPKWLSHAICRSWNRVACLFLEHSVELSVAIYAEFNQTPVCVWCCKKLGTQVA